MPATLVTLLGTAQDGGVPQPGCEKSCCMDEFGGVTRSRSPVALGITASDGSRHLVEAGRELSSQLVMWASVDGGPLGRLDSVWLTHGHLGHVDGLGLFGCEAMGTNELPLHASESMLEVVKDSPMLAQLLTNRHLRANQFSTGEKVSLGAELTITPLQVPHRDEHSDTHAFLIEGAAKKLLFLPDHDSWEMTLDIHQADGPLEWFRSLFVDVVLIDGTFWSADELGGKAADIGHPPVEETLSLLGDRGPSDPRVVFIHLNHTNPLHDESSAASAKVRAMGWEIARQPMTFGL